MLPLSPAFSVLPVQRAGALVPFTACSKMEAAEKMPSAAFLTVSLEMCAVVLLALGSRAAFWLAAGERLVPPHRWPGRFAGIPAGRYRDRVAPSPAASRHPHPQWRAGRVLPGPCSRPPSSIPACPPSLLALAPIWVLW